MTRVGGAKRCSRVQRVRYCFLCKQEVRSGHKFFWMPVNQLGYYRLQHRNCDFPDCYDHSTKALRLQSAQFARLFGRNMTRAQRELLQEVSID